MADLLHPKVAAPEQDQESLPPPEDPGDFAVAGQAKDALQARLLADALDQAGIPAFVDAARDGMVRLLAAPAEGFLLRVPARDLERATALLEEHRAALESDPEAGARAADEAEAAEEQGPKA
jgi:hypothetical protein